jgi:hypothetical protein
MSILLRETRLLGRPANDYYDYNYYNGSGIMKQRLGNYETTAREL